MTGLDLERIKQAIEYLTNNKLKRPEIVNDYNQKNVSNKLVKIIISFINFINENNYKKKYWIYLFYHIIFGQKILRLMI